jgi:predicted permease
MLEWTKRWLRRIRLVARRRDADRAMADEMRYHVDRQVEELIAAGMPAAAARREAAVRFGGVDRFREEGRDARGVASLEDFASDARIALRMLRHSPGFTAAAVLTLGLGIGANTAVFSVVDGVVLRPLPYPDADRVLYLGWDWNGSGQAASVLSAYKFEFFRERNHAFAAVATHRERTVGLGERGEGGDVGVLRVGGDFFDVIGFHPRAGREFTAEEMRAGGPSVAIVSDAFWRERLGGDPAVIGREVLLADARYTIVGVMQPEFSFPPSAGYTDVIVPLGLVADPTDTGHNYPVLVRLAPGVTRDEAEADIQRVAGELWRVRPELHAMENERPGLVSFQDLFVGELQATLWVLLGAVSLVLLIACANVANLLLARGTARRRELAIRATLGAGRGRIARQVLSESIVLALMGGLLGAAVGATGLKLLIGLAPARIPRLELVGIDGRVLAFTLAVSLVTGLLFGLVAAFPAGRVDLAGAMRENQRSAGTSRSRARGRDLLIAAEAAFAMMLLAGAALLIDSFTRLRGTELGFDPGSLMSVTFSRVPGAYDEPGRIVAAERGLVARMREVPGVEAVAAASSVPLDRGWNLPMTVEGRPDASEGAVEWRGVSADYFEVLGLEFVRGRGFTDAEVASGQPVMVVNEALARLYFPDGGALGKRILVGYFQGTPMSGDWIDAPREIVGVVADVREMGPAEPPRRTMYIPHEHTPRVMMSFPQFLIRTRTGITSDAVRAAARDADPALPVPALVSLQDRLASTLAPDRFNTLLMSVFAAVALVLTAIGIYGVVAYVVRQRTAEIGIRMALGARRADVLGATVARGMAPVVVGLGAGIIGALALTRYLSSMLHGVSPTSARSYIAVSIVLCAVGMLACYIPALRAASVDPMRALRTD